MRKLVFYQKNSNKPIVMTDRSASESIEDIKANLLEVMGSHIISSIQTDSDLFIFRPDDISGIMITDPQNKNSDKLSVPNKYSKDLDDISIES